MTAGGVQSHAPDPEIFRVPDGRSWTAPI